MSDRHSDQNERPSQHELSRRAEPGRGPADGSPDDLLGRELRSRFGHQPFVPDAVHDAVLARAESHFVVIRGERSQRSGGRWIAYGGGVAAAAAMLVVVAWLGDPFQPAEAPPRTAEAPVDVVPGDVTGDGRVDVLDMLALARKLERGEALPAHADLTGDGEVTEADLAALGERIVALDVEPQSRREPQS